MTSHPVRADALIGGLIFAVISAVWLIDHFKVLEIDLALNLNLILPGILIIGGLLGIVATLRKPNRNGETHE
mgnify:CR=1 FL=1